MAKGQPGPGRVAGVPNRDKAELRALIQERVHEYTELRRAQDVAALPPDMTEEDAHRQGILQEIIDDYDPVVSLSLVAVDRRTSLENRIKCHAEVAQYVRPKLKSVEVKTDPEAMEMLEERRALSEQLVGLLEAAAAAKKSGAARRRPPPPAAGPPEGE